MNCLIKHEFESLEQLQQTPLFCGRNLTKVTPLGSIIQIDFTSKDSIKRQKSKRRQTIKEFRKNNPNYVAPKHVYASVFTINYNFTKQEIKINFDTSVTDSPSLLNDIAKESPKVESSNVVESSQTSSALNQVSSILAPSTSLEDNSTPVRSRRGAPLIEMRKRKAVEVVVTEEMLELEKKYFEIIASKKIKQN